MAANRVTLVALEALTTGPGNARVTQVVAEVLALTWELRLRKSVGYAAVDLGGPDVRLRKGYGFAVLSGSADLSLRKAYGYAVLHDTSVNLSGRRRALTIAG